MLLRPNSSFVWCAPWADIFGVISAFSTALSVIHFPHTVHWHLLGGFLPCWLLSLLMCSVLSNCLNAFEVVHPCVGWRLPNVLLSKNILSLINMLFNVKLAGLWSNLDVIFTVHFFKHIWIVNLLVVLNWRLLLTVKFGVWLSFFWFRGG